MRTTTVIRAGVVAFCTKLSRLGFKGVSWTIVIIDTVIILDIIESIAVVTFSDSQPKVVDNHSISAKVGLVAIGQSGIISSIHTK